jgi:hypothetical protein
MEPKIALQIISSVSRLEAPHSVPNIVMLSRSAVLKTLNSYLAFVSVRNKDSHPHNIGTFIYFNIYVLIYEERQNILNRMVASIPETLPALEAQNLLGCTAVFLIECRLTFQRYVLPPSSGR